MARPTKRMKSCARPRAQCEWIELVRDACAQGASFCGQGGAFNAGYERVKDLDFDVVGNLDADVSFEPDHFEFLIGKMSENPRLGVAGAPFREGKFQYDYRFYKYRKCLGRMPAFSARMLRGHRWIHATEGRLHRSCRCSFGAACTAGKREPSQRRFASIIA